MLHLCLDQADADHSIPFECCSPSCVLQNSQCPIPQSYSLYHGFNDAIQPIVQISEGPGAPHCEMHCPMRNDWQIYLEPLPRSHQLSGLECSVLAYLTMFVSQALTRMQIFTALGSCGGGGLLLVCSG